VNDNANVLPLNAETLQSQAAARLRTLLIEGGIPPGSKLNERDLAERLRISRTPLREAIRMLAAEGLVELLPNRGAVAVKLGVQDVADTFEVLAGLEAQSGELAAQRITPAALAEVKALHFEMLACHARQDLSGYYRLNAQIHSAINAAAANPVLTRTYEQINARLQALRFRSNQDTAKWQAAVREHEQMIAALEARDGPALRSVLLQHLNHKRDTVLALMAGGDVMLAT
jgi:DNA-binding GntR family transcriptional regulator